MKKQFDVYIPKERIEYRPLENIIIINNGRDFITKNSTSTNDYVTIPAEPRVIDLSYKCN